MKTKVLVWIERNFDLEAVTAQAFELLPAGHRVIDKHGDEMLVYFDILSQQIKIIDGNPA